MNDTNSHPTRDKLVEMMSNLIGLVNRISSAKDIEPAELAALPALVNSITYLTTCAVIEKKN